MREKNVVNTFFLTKKEIKDMVLINSILDLDLDINVIYGLEIGLLPINCHLGFGSCRSELLNNVIRLQRNEFYFDGGLEGLYGVLASTLDMPVEQGKGHILYGDGIVCHNMFIVTLFKISRGDY